MNIQLFSDCSLQRFRATVISRSNCTSDREQVTYSCKQQVSAATFPMMGHMLSWLQWQGRRCHHSPQKASPACAPDAEQRVLHQRNPTGAIPCSLVDGSARREHTQTFGLSPALLTLWLALCSLKLFDSVRVPYRKPKVSPIYMQYLVRYFAFHVFPYPSLVPGASTKNSTHEPHCGVLQLAKACCSAKVPARNTTA